VVEVCAGVARAVEACVREGQLPLVLGGDHSQSIGSIAGLARHYSLRGERLGVLWVDAHADMNTPETSPSGNIHGMPLAALLGYGCDALTGLSGGRPALAAEHVVLFGVRNIDPGEEVLIRRSGVRVFAQREIDERGLAACLAEALDILGRASAGFHLSYDLDAIDPATAPGVSTPVPGGLSYLQSRLLCEAVAQSGRLVGMEMVELNPSLDVDRRAARAAVHLIQAALRNGVTCRRSP
jgi:arginase